MSAEMEQLYQAVILDHSRSRQGSGEIPQDASNTSHQVNPTCGDEVTLAVEVDDDGKITDLVWDGDGCSISQASLSVMSEAVVGMDAKDRQELARTFNKMMHLRGQMPSEDELDVLEDAAAFSGVSKFPARVKCALLGWMALQGALSAAGVDENYTEGE
ncbi:SUF system NifU family Fe-S cluster assembly protein [Boudabousia tangfeifanii]|uniref:SUF system NifU family Fe-S cluster assembly protein n=1 Tax=Boudabousia tangfeifanii TaxID=1912795 RepID=A0A1D9MKG9_9ACTO|nr:SUF system NifU family Fe-S cluster assembly protein [Boudabousia tangfeifanii]AOZ72807.1 SUF system NifU family Fe-S cluster assembly protein [Boudabousia tangfeifanii]